MNPAKLLDDVLSTLSRYAPSLIVHFLLLLWLSLRVVDPGTLPSEEVARTWVGERIDSALSAIGLSLDRWYVLAVFAFAYLTAFQWLVSVCLQLPLLRLPYGFTYEPDVLGDAARVMPRRPTFLGGSGDEAESRPDSWSVASNLHDLVDHMTTEFREAGREHPYQWMFDRHTTWLRYYGALLVALLSMVFWALEGASLARSTGRVWEAVAILIVICLIVRWRLRRDYLAEVRALAYWALRQLELRDTSARSDRLDWERSKLVRKHAAFEQALRQHPTSVVRRLYRFLPQQWQRRLERSLRHFSWRQSEDWQLFASSEMRMLEEAGPTPQALQAGAFATRFAALLECKGSGLAMLAPRQLGWAPAAAGGGAIYCFSERRHSYGALSVELRSAAALDGADFGITGYGERSFIVCIGAFPIERLAQDELPDIASDVRALVSAVRYGAAWPEGPSTPSEDAERVSPDRVPVQPGSSYLIVTRTPLDTRALVAFQCFRIDGSERLLLAWRILEVQLAESEPPAVKPWWQAAAWRELLREPDTG